MKAAYRVEAGYIMQLVPKIADERIAQMKKWSDCQRLPDGTGIDYQDEMLNAQDACNRAYKRGELTHAHIFEEEAWEVLAEPDPVKLREELIQVMAVCAKWIEDIDKRGDAR